MRKKMNQSDRPCTGCKQMSRKSATFFSVCWRSAELQRVHVSYHDQIIEKEKLLENVNAVGVFKQEVPL